jgi:zinc/manganese transport system substrate-binding protein
MVFFKKCFKEISLYCFLFLILGNLQGVSEGKLLVVGTTEHEALLAKGVGGDLIDIRWIVGADMNPQSMEPDRSFVPILNKADILLVNGQGLEAGWLTVLLKEAKNQKILPGGEGYISLSEGVVLLPYAAEELQGSRFQEILNENGIDQLFGNHHYWLDPENSIPMLENIKKAFMRIDPPNSGSYESNAAKLVTKLNEKIKEWDAKMAPYKGKKIISYHRGWTYLAQRHGLDIVSYIEPKEMARPKEEDFKRLASRFKDQNVSLVLLSGSERPPFVNVDSVTDLGVRLHAHTIILPESMNPSEKRGDIIAYFDYLYKVLTAILK